MANAKLVSYEDRQLKILKDIASFIRQYLLNYSFQVIND